MNLSKHLQSAVLGIVFSLGGIANAPAQLIPANDNTSEPYVGIFGGALEDAVNWNDNFTSWLNRSQVWAEGFNGGATSTSYSWTNGVEGNSNYFKAAKRWVDTHPGAVYVLGVPMLPGNGGTPTSGHTLAIGATGAYDSHFVTLAQKLVNHGPPDESIIIRLGWEFNGWWYPWCIDTDVPGRQPEDFAAYFKRIVTVMKAVPGCENLRFCWNGSTNWTGYNISRAYPVDKDASENIIKNDYVDYVGIDVYDTAQAYPGTTQAIRDAAWAEKVGNAKNNIWVWQNVANSPDYGQGKPLSFPEWGLSTSTSNGGGDNPEFIRHMYEFMHNPANNVAWHVYFDNFADGSDHRIHTLPWGTLTNPVAAAKFKQLFGLPLPNKNDIGTTGLAGTTDGITVSGAGTGYLAATSDNFFFSSRDAAAEDLFVIKLISMSSSASAQSGVMIRQSTAANAIYAALILNNGKCSFQARTATGAAAVPYGMALDQAAPTEAAPVWLKMMRKGNSITGYVSTDSVNWNYVGGQSVAVGTSAKIGLAISSGDTTSLNATGLDKGTDKMDHADFYVGFDEKVDNSIVVDDADTTPGAIVKTGTWTPASTIFGYFGGSYLTGPASGTASVKFTPNLPAAGLYSVFVRWPQDAAFTYDAPLTIVSAEGTVGMTANQSVGKKMWHYAGTYSFAQGTAGSVTIGRSNTYGTTVADSVMFVPAPQNLIVDNANAVLGGVWTTSTKATGQYHGADYRTDGSLKSPVRTAQFTPNIPKTGTYKVYSAWSVLTGTGTVYPSNVPYTITHADGTTNLPVNHQQNGGKWNLIGTYKFNAGTGGNVLISNANTTGALVVDAVRFVYVPPTEVIVDNQQANLTEGTGTWTPSTGAEGQFYGADYLKDDNAGKGTKKARFTPNLPSAGTYKVYAKWSVMVGTSYSNSVSYIVSHSGGTDPSLAINQRVNGGLWNLIGTYTFPAGSSPTTGSVLITNTGTGNVIVDAVKFVKE